MSVLVSDRTESKFEAITYSIELHDMLIDLMQRSFGVKDLDQLVRVRYAHGKDATEDFSRYRYLMLNYKNRIDQLASMLTSNVRAANSIYPTTLHEYEKRRDYQNTAIVKSYSASLKQREFLRRSILKGPIHQVILNGEDVPKKIHHEFLGSLLPFAGFDRNLVSPIQVVGVTDNLLIVHKSFTVIAILTVVNCVRLCYLSIRKG